MPNQGEKASTFTLYDHEKKARTLEELLKPQGSTVLAFFPGAFTGVCTREMCAFRDLTSELNKVHAQVVAVSVNDPFSNRAFAQQNNLNFPVLSDYNREVVRKYNVFHENFAGLTGYTAAKRSVFILDPDGVVTYKWVSEDPGKEPNYEELKREAAKITA